MSKVPAIDPARKQAIEIALEEYRALYGLVQLRLTALESRSVAAVLSLGGGIGGFATLDDDMAVLAAFAAPLLLVWLVQSTTTHAKSFEDAVRRIAEIELLVNQLSGTEVLCFQSSHPSSSRAGGRTGRDAVIAVMLAALVIFGLSIRLVVFQQENSVLHDRLFLGFITVMVAFATTRIVRSFRYNYSERRRSLNARRPSDT